MISRLWALAGAGLIIAGLGQHDSAFVVAGVAALATADITHWLRRLAARQA